MSETPAKTKSVEWLKNSAMYKEGAVVILLGLFMLFLQYGSISYKVLLSYHAFLTIIAGLCVWFANRFTLDFILQSRIESNKITRYLPFELIAASMIVTSVIYVIVYFIFNYLEELNFVLTNFLQGLSVTIGISLLIALLYVISQVWKSWWKDGEFLFRINNDQQDESVKKDSITIKNSRNTVIHDLNNVNYFISESKIVFMIDTSGKKWVTQYNLSELEKILEGRFFRLNRKILVSHQVISHIKKLPNHRLLVSIGPSNEGHQETISRYKSTKFKQWFHTAANNE